VRGASAVTGIEAVRAARAWLSRAVEPGHAGLHRLVDRYGPVEARRLLQAAPVPDDGRGRGRRAERNNFDSAPGTGIGTGRDGRAGASHLGAVGRVSSVAPAGGRAAGHWGPGRAGEPGRRGRMPSCRLHRPPVRIHAWFDAADGERWRREGLRPPSFGCPSRLSDEIAARPGCSSST